MAGGWRESSVVMSPAVNLGAAVCLTTQTMSDIVTHFPDRESSLIMAALSWITFKASLTRGWIVETSGPHHSFQLELEVPLLEQEGEAMLGLFLPDRVEDPHCQLNTD